MFCVYLAATHRVAAIVAEVAVAVTDRDRPAVVARGGVDLELGELGLPVGWARVRVGGHLQAGPFEQGCRCRHLRRGRLHGRGGRVAVGAARMLAAAGRRFAVGAGLSLPIGQPARRRGGGLALTFGVVTRGGPSPPP